MKFLIRGAPFVAALVVSASAWAQAQTTPPATTAPAIKLPAQSQAPTTTQSGSATTAPNTPRPKRQVRRTRRYVQHYPSYEEDYYREDYYGRAGLPDDDMADELNSRQLQGGWYGAGAPYPYAPYAPYAPSAPYMPYPAPPTYYSRGY